MYFTNRTRCRLTAFVLCIFLALTLPLTALAAYPSHTDYLSDADNILSDDTAATILSVNDTLYTQKGVRIAICLTSDTDGDIVNFSRTLFTKWDMCNGVLLVLDTTSQVYFAVQSVDIDDILTNTILQEILVANMESDFSAGNTNRSVANTVNALYQFMMSNLPDVGEAEAPAQTDENGEPTEEDEPGVFVKIMRFLLGLVLFVIAAGAALFIAAMFNDDVCDFVRTYILRNNKRRVPPQQAYYDDRLYGGNPNQRNPQNPYNPYGRNGQYNRQDAYPPRQQRPQRPQDPYDPYNDYNMQYQQPQRQSRPPQQGYPQQQGYGQQQRYAQQQGYNRQQGYNQQQGYAQQQNYGYNGQGAPRQNPQGQRRPGQNPNQRY